MVCLIMKIEKNCMNANEEWEKGTIDERENGMIKKRENHFRDRKK